MEERVARVGDLAEGQMRQVSVGGKKVLLTNSGGVLRAFSSGCPHYGAPLHDGLLHDGRLVCPAHQSVFDATSGDLLEPPASASLTEFTVRIDGHDVYVDRPDDARNQRPLPAAAPDPSADSRTFAIIGSGAAAAAAAVTLRAEGFQGRIVMLGAEDRWPYDRPNLSKDYLSGEVRGDWLPLHPAQFYRDIGVERQHRRVTLFNVESREIMCDDDVSLTPDAVLIASGATPRSLDVPGADLPGILTLRSWDDAKRVIAVAEKASRAVVIGTGFIGTEVAAALRHRGLKVTLVGPDTVPLERVLGPDVGSVVNDLHADAGVRLALSARVARFKGQNAVKSVELESGESFSADLVVVGIGVRPATDFIEGVVHNMDGGIEVDSRLKVADGVWAAGDIARYPERHVRQAVRIEHWRLALQHGRHAARAMLGSDEPFSGVPFFWTTQFGVDLHFAGVGQGWERVVIKGDLAVRDFVALYVRGNDLLAACGTRTLQVAAFAELMRSDRLPKATDVEEGAALDLTKLL